MKLNKNSPLLLICIVICSLSVMQVQAATGGKPAFVRTNKPHPVSNRLIVKLKTGKPEQAMSVQHSRPEPERPLAADVMQRLQSAAGVPMSELRTTGGGAHVLVLRGTQSVAQAVAAMGRLPEVEYVEEDHIETIQAVPNDSYYTTGPTGYPGLWALQPVTAATLPSSGNDGSYGADFQTAWNTSIGSGVVVAVLDTGIRPHPDIVGPNELVAAGPESNLVSSGYNFITDCRLRGVTSSNGCAANTADVDAGVAPEQDATDTGDFVTTQDKLDNPTLFPVPASSSWHGTHVAGIIAARGNNNLGVIGGAYGAKILPVRVLGKGGGWSTDISDGIRWAAGVHPTIFNPTPAKVINLSLGSLVPCSTSRQAAIDAAVSAGSVVVAAAGNENLDVADSSSANCHNVISVAATGRNGSRAYYSNFSSPTSNTTNPVTVTLAAQGGEQLLATYDPGILSTVDSGTTIPVGSTYAYKQGTSMATPYVSATVALMLAYQPALTPSRVKQILSMPAALTPFPSFDASILWADWDCSLNQNCGAGILNAKLVLQNTTLLPPASSGGGGGCAIQPYGMPPDHSLLLALLAVAIYRFRRRLFRERSAH